MKKVQKPTLFKQASQFSDLQSKWDLVDTLMGGTDAMRDAGRQYLKQNPKEPNPKYLDRLSRATLTNKYSRTIEKSIGKAFARKMNIILPIGMEDIQYNIDGQGTSLESFSKNLLKDAINYGITYVLVDYPSSVGPTLKDQRASNAFPYFVEIKPTQLLDLRVEYINNKLQLTYFRFYEAVTEYGDTLAELTNIEQVREYIRTDTGVSYNVWQKTKDKAEVLIDSGNMSVDMIPIVPIYGKRTQAYMGEPVLMDLAHLNAKHWWKQSDLDWNEHYGLTPILGIKGFSNQQDPETGANTIDDFTVSSSTVVALGDNGDLKWTTADSAGIKAAQDSLDRLLKEMDEAGLELTTRQEGGSETATGRILDANEANSILKGIVVDLNWQLYQAMLIAGRYVGIDATDADITIDTSYTTTTASNTQDLTLLRDLFKDKIITLEEMRLELKSRKLFVSEKVDETMDKVPDQLITKEPVVNQVS